MIANGFYESEVPLKTPGILVIKNYFNMRNLNKCSADIGAKRRVRGTLANQNVQPTLIPCNMKF